LLALWALAEVMDHLCAKADSKAAGWKPALQKAKIETRQDYGPT
jgi:hypothetical protein